MDNKSSVHIIEDQTTNYYNSTNGQWINRLHNFTIFIWIFVSNIRDGLNKYHVINNLSNNYIKIIITNLQLL